MTVGLKVTGNRNQYPGLNVDYNEAVIGRATFWLKYDKSQVSLVDSRITGQGSRFQTSSILHRPAEGMIVPYFYNPTNVIGDGTLAEFDFDISNMRDHAAFEFHDFDIRMYASGANTIRKRMDNNAVCYQKNTNTVVPTRPVVKEDGCFLNFAENTAYKGDTNNILKFTEPVYKSADVISVGVEMSPQTTNEVSFVVDYDETQMRFAGSSVAVHGNSFATKQLQQDVVNGKVGGFFNAVTPVAGGGLLAVFDFDISRMTRAAEFRFIGDNNVRNTNNQACLKPAGGTVMSSYATTGSSYDVNLDGVVDNADESYLNYITAVMAGEEGNPLTYNPLCFTSAYTGSCEFGGAPAGGAMAMFNRYQDAVNFIKNRLLTADFNHDGRFNNKDMAMLRIYLSGADPSAVTASRETITQTTSEVGQMTYTGISPATYQIGYTANTPGEIIFSAIATDRAGNSAASAPDSCRFTILTEGGAQERTLELRGIRVERIDEVAQNPKADFNRDGIVDFTDFRMFELPSSAASLIFDVNSDGYVNFDDFFIFADNFAKVVRSSVAPPDARADIDGSGVIDFDDFFMIADALNSRSTDPRYDLNRNGIVDVGDIDIITRNFGAVTGY